MALGGGSNNNQNNKKSTPTVYSEYGSKNDNGIDPSALSFEYFGALLAVKIAPILANPTETQKYDYKNAKAAYLTHTKAILLAREIKNVLNGDYPIGGVNSSDKLISFSDGKELGASFYCLTIRELDVNGSIVSSHVYEFKNNFHYSIQNFDQTTSNYDKCFHDNIEIEQLIYQLESYAESMTNAVAATVRRQLHFDLSPINTKIDGIAESLGVKTGNGGNRRSGQSFFNNSTANKPANTSTGAEKSLDDL